MSFRIVVQNEKLSLCLKNIGNIYKSIFIKIVFRKCYKKYITVIGKL